MTRRNRPASYSKRTILADRRAVDSIVATVVVIAVTLIAAVAVSGFVFGSFGGGANAPTVGVTGVSLYGSDFQASGSSTTFTCSTAPGLGSSLALTNTGTGLTSVTSVTFRWAGGNTVYNPSGSCNIGATGSAASTLYLLFPITSTIAPSALSGQPFTGSVSLSSGAQPLLTGTWQ